MNGELIGIVNAKSSSSDAEGLGFAIPINDAIKVAQDLLENGYVTGRPYMGITYLPSPTHRRRHSWASTPTASTSWTSCPAACR